MTVTRQRPEIPPNKPLADDDARRVINETRRGRLNNGGEVTLTANAATTTLADVLISTNSRVFLSPQTANAAAALATTYFGTPMPGSVVITHANNAQTDRIFAYGVFF